MYVAFKFSDTVPHIHLVMVSFLSTKSVYCVVVSVHVVNDLTVSSPVQDEYTVDSLSYFHEFGVQVT